MNIVSGYQINRHCLNYITSDTQLCTEIITQHTRSCFNCLLIDIYFVMATPYTVCQKDRADFVKFFL